MGNHFPQRHSLEENVKDINFENREIVTSGASAGYAAVFLPCKTPAAANPNGAWQSSATAFTGRKSAVVAMKNAMGNDIEFKYENNGNILNIDNNLCTFRYIYIPCQQHIINIL